MQDFYYPILNLIPSFDGDAVERIPFRLVKRKWQTSIFDLATLATKHKLHLPYQVMDVFLSQCHLELCIVRQESLNEANAIFKAFRLGLYSSQVSPFLAPFVTSHSINEYSGINSRDSDYLKEKLDPDMMKGIKSDEGVLEAWPFEMTFRCITIREKLNITSEAVLSAFHKVDSWLPIIAKTSSLRVVQDAANSAPKFVSLDQSLLHIWTALEALFPNVSTELSFKIALYIAQLMASSSERLNVYERVKESYSLRSKIAHGAKRGISMKQWLQSWELILEAFNAVVARGKMPSEKELLTELLS